MYSTISDEQLDTIINSILAEFPHSEPMQFLYSFHSVKLIGIYVVTGPSPARSNSLLDVYAQDFQLDGLCKW